MKPKSRFLLFPVFICVASLPILFGQAQKKSPVAYPTGYRKWTHVKSMVIFSKEHKLFANFGGLHNVYVNDIGWPSLQKSRTYPDGSILVFELFDISTSQGAIEARGGRKFLAVMKKNSKQYAPTGGWGFEVFQGYEATGSLKDAKQCFDCHASQKMKDFVFSDYME